MLDRSALAYRPLRKFLRNVVSCNGVRINSHVPYMPIAWWGQMNNIWINIDHEHYVPRAVVVRINVMLKIAKNT